jgi:hypothetical protein
MRKTPKTETAKRPLKLARETLRSLSPDELALAGGGFDGGDAFRTGGCYQFRSTGCRI